MTQGTQVSAEPEDQAIEFEVCGRIIGAATGWDLIDTFSMMLYNFKPADIVDGKLPSGDVALNFELGTVETYNDNGAVTFSGDLLDLLQPYQRKKYSR